MPRIFPQAGRKLWKNPPILLENGLFLYSYVTSCPFPLQSNGCFVILIFSKVWKGEYAVKRVFALCLAVFLILTACMLSAAAAPAAKQVFFDQAEIRNPGAVRMLVDLGLISGYTDGSFRPAAPVTREEIAKVIARLCTDDPQAENLTAFADTAGSWGNLYVCFCAERGVITGDGQGSFRPKDAVTARELAKMLLVVLGEDGTRYTGSGWGERVDADALRLGIYNGFGGKLDSAVSRDDACLLIYNAMQCPAVVNEKATGMMRYALDDLMNPKTYMETRFGLVRYTGVLEANECADLTMAGGKLAAGMSKLAGHKEFAVSSDLSLLGRTVDIYMLNGEAVGSPVASAGEIYYTFADAQELKAVCDSNSFTFADNCSYYSNFEPATADILSSLPENAKITVIDHTGDLKFDVVLVTSVRTATVVSTDPLTISLGMSERPAERYAQTDVFAVGQSVLSCEVRGVTYIRADS